MIKQYLELGQIVGTHGVRGEMKLDCWCDSPAFVQQFKTVFLDPEGNRSVDVLSSRPHKNQVLIRLGGVDTVEQAEACRGKVLYIRRADAGLKEGAWFIAELIGCRAYDADDPEKLWGEITDVYNTGANDIWVIRTPEGKDVHIPAIPDVVIGADVAADRAVIRPLKGLFDDAN
ncbi:MAG: 16S rRNA processing protein RimM [Clostridia bacterium]|jgi:16S rRNA processing protein RimM|nr:16S rRNA processing protein RimM [Clostridia bacterium]